MILRTLPKLLAAALCLLLLPLTLSGCDHETAAEHAANLYAAHELASAPPHGNLPDYSLSPADLAKAQHLSTVDEVLHFGDEAWGILTLLLLLGLGIIARLRDTALPIGQVRWLQAIFYPYTFIVFTLLIDLLPAAAIAPIAPHLSGQILEAVALMASGFVVWRYRKQLRASTYRWVEGYSFLFLFLLITTLLSLPIDLYAHHLSLTYGLSVQHWPSWFADQAKTFGLTLLIGGLLVMLLFWIIRKLPRTWWFAFWCVSIPILLLGIFAAPYIEPIFFHYQPLQQADPALVAQLEKVVEKGHMNIPPQRMFLMKASAKLTTINADVEGFGASKRVVVWDTTIAKMTPDEIVFVFGHESGHYVLHHIASTILFTLVILFLSFYLGFLFVHWAITRFGSRWHIASQNDWAALAILLLAFSLFGTLLEPIENSYSRMHEHAADVYGQEAVHGLVPDPQTTARNAFDVLGKTSFEDPNPNPLFEFWTYNHPSIGRRAAFATAYNPWAPGMQPKYFKK